MTLNPTRQPEESQYLRLPEGQTGLRRIPAIPTIIGEGKFWGISAAKAQQAGDRQGANIAADFLQLYSELFIGRIHIQDLLDSGKNLAPHAPLFGDWYARCLCIMACGSLCREVLDAPGRKAQIGQLGLGVPLDIAPNLEGLQPPRNPFDANVYASAVGLGRLGLAAPEPGQATWYKNRAIYAKLEPPPATPTVETLAFYATQAEAVGFPPEFPVDNYATITPYLKTEEWHRVLNLSDEPSP